MKDWKSGEEMDKHKMKELWHVLKEAIGPGDALFGAGEGTAN